MSVLVISGWVVALTLALVAATGGLVIRRRVLDAVHEINRPLAAVRLGLASAARHPGSPAATLAALDGELERAARSVRLLCAPVGRRGGAARAKRIDLAALAGELAASWTPIARAAGREVVFRPLVGTCLVEGEADSIGRAAANLIANSIEHGGGTIELGVESLRRGGRLTVTDSGEGPLRLPGGPAGRRGGRGISIASREISRHGGRLVKAPGSGVVTAIELPAKE